MSAGLVPEFVGPQVPQMGVSGDVFLWSASLVQRLHAYHWTVGPRGLGGIGYSQGYGCPLSVPFGHGCFNAGRVWDVEVPVLPKQTIVFLNAAT